MATVISNQPFAAHSWAVAGTYFVELRAYNATHIGGVTASVEVHVVDEAVHFAKDGHTNAVAPYDSWETAASTIQDAIDAAHTVGSLVWVAAGTYDTGTVLSEGGRVNRIAITNYVVVRSVDGPEHTSIVGVPYSGFSAVRCAYVGPHAVLSGFTLTNGNATTHRPEPWLDEGGGAWCAPSAVLSNCHIRGNRAEFSGGGVFGGTLIDCSLIGNVASSNGGGAAYAALNNCLMETNQAWGAGGGSAFSVLTGCTLIQNRGKQGGGATSCTLSNCTITGNTADWGGGAYDSILYDCRLTQNAADTGGGASGATLVRCVLEENRAVRWGGGSSQGHLSHCSLSRNVSEGYGGGSFRGRLDNCVLVENQSQRSGGGAFGATLNNCWLGGNVSFEDGGGTAGGTAFGGIQTTGTLNNCTLVGNTCFFEGGGQKMPR